MVKLALICIVAALAATPSLAQAQESGDDDAPAFNMLDMRFGVGALPVAGSAQMTISLGLGIEHPVFKKTRVFGEYEWMWLFDRGSDRTYMLNPPPPERHGTGQRAMLGLRRELLGKGGHSLRAFLDGEIGGGLALANDNMRGLQTLPSAFAGLRVGYDMYSRVDDSPSRTFEFEMLYRVIAVPDGLGMMFGIGMAWGN